MAPLEILWEDPYGLAVNKPAGLLVHPGATTTGETTLEQLVRRYLRPEDPASAYLGTVHRLDRPVSGVILWAKTRKAASRWAELFRARQVRKEYWALVESDDPASLFLKSMWDDWILGPDRSGRARITVAETSGASRAMTRMEQGSGEYHPRDAATTFVKLFPETGRTHQLRAQAAERGCPIIGDRTYGSVRDFGVGIALHARSLTLQHPIRREPLTITANLPAEWMAQAASTP